MKKFKLEERKASQKIVEQLRILGYDVSECVPSLQAVQDFLRDYYQTEIFIYPVFGSKIDYDTYKLLGYGFNSELKTDEGGIMLYPDFMLKEYKTYLYANLSDSDMKAEDSIKYFPTYEGALKVAISTTLTYLADNGIPLHKPDPMIPPEHWPDCIFFDSLFEGPHTPLSIGSELSDKCMRVYGDGLVIKYENKEYLVKDTGNEDKRLLGKLAYPCEKWFMKELLKEENNGNSNN